MKLVSVFIQFKHAVSAERHLQYSHKVQTVHVRGMQF